MRIGNAGKVLVSAVLPALVLFAAGCGEGTLEPSPDAVNTHLVGRGGGEARAAFLVRLVRVVTSRFHSQRQATRAGYAEASPCIAAPGLGAMGFHWVNDGLVDPVFEPLRPEAVLYAPTHHGKLKLVAVEYIVMNVGQPAPTFGGHPFDVGGTPVPVPHWSLHVWAHEENPAGVFTPFNPALSCGD